MNAAPADELMAALSRCATALDGDDLDAASTEMDAAADLCRRLQAAGMSLPGPELTRLRELYERCGVALAETGQKLNAASFRDGQHRRGMEAYRSKG